MHSHPALLSKSSVKGGVKREPRSLRDSEGRQWGKDSGDSFTPAARTLPLLLPLENKPQAEAENAHDRQDHPAVS